MDSRGQLFAKGELKNSSKLFLTYQQLSAKGFADLASLSADELDWIAEIHGRYLDFYREERRMHFGAFALVGLALIILFPALLSASDYFLPLLGVEALLFILLVPYTFVYRRYEEGVRRMMRESILIENARRLTIEARQNVRSE